MLASAVRAQLASPVQIKTKSFSGNALKAKPQLRRAGRPQAAARNVTVMAASYICIDCGYIYDGSEGPFEKLPNSYKCPSCSSTKRRFKPWSGATGKNDGKAMKARMQQLKSAGGGAAAPASGSDSNPLVLVAAGAAVLIALAVGLNGYYN